MFNRPSLLRAFLVALIGACNSEILWGNMHPTAFFVDVGVWLVYVPMLVFIDLFVRLRHYGYVRVWLAGLLFGIVLEAGMVGMVAEGFGIMVMVMSWHACLTVTLTIMIADLLVPRTLLPDKVSRPGKLAFGLTALAGLVMMVSMFAAFGLWAILARPFDFLLCLLVVAVVGTVLYRRRARREVPHPSVWVILGLAGLGFYLGLHLIEIENADPLKQPYTPLDYQIRAAVYGLLGLIVLSKVVWQRRAGQ